MSLTNSRTSWADLMQKEVWGWELMTSRSMSQPSALSGLLLLESWCLHIQGPGPERAINEDRCSENAHTLSSVRLPLQLLQVRWRLVGLSLLSLTNLIPFKPKQDTIKEIRIVHIMQDNPLTGIQNLGISIQNRN